MSDTILEYYRLRSVDEETMRALAIAATEHKGHVILVTTKERAGRFRELITEMLAARRFSYMRGLFTITRGQRQILIATDFRRPGLGGAVLIDPVALTYESATIEEDFSSK